MTTPQVARLLNVTYRQLSSWVSRGLIDVPCHGSGDARVWTESQVARAREIRDAYLRAGDVLKAAAVPVPWEQAGRRHHNNGSTVTVGRAHKEASA